MRSPSQSKKRHFTDAARAAAKLARAAKRAEPDDFGDPNMFVVRHGDGGVTWELRRFGGVVLQRGAASFVSQALARSEGATALAALCASPDLPTFKRERNWKAAPSS